jgi:uncharacterized membrane protein YhhN
MDADRLLHNVQVVLLLWNEVKQSVGQVLTLSHDILHLYVGILLLLAAAVLLQRPVSSWRPWLVVIVLACLNELGDLLVEQWPERAIQYGESVKDVLITMALPTMLLITSRSLPWLYDSSSAGPPKATRG